jgi:cyclohexyl-isocyanide hydratase
MNVVFLLFPNITQLDFTGPAQVLSRLPGATTSVATRDGAPLGTDSGFAIVPTHRFADAPPADILCVPGGHGVAEALACPETIAFARAQAGRAKWVTSVCTGAFILGAAGLLKGKRATTHWAYHHLLPLVGAEPVEARVVEDGNTITAGGVTSGIDFALTLAAREAGEEWARGLQLALEYDPAPPFAAGHPRAAGEDAASALRARTYSAAAETMRSALMAAAKPR